jgi:hypothetical protein
MQKDDRTAVIERLEASYRHGEEDFYVDSDMPSDVEFSGACARNHHDHHHHHRDEAFSLHTALKSAEDMFKSAIDAWRPTGFPFHHFPAPKGSADALAPAKTETDASSFEP